MSYVQVTTHLFKQLLATAELLKPWAIQSK